MSDLTTRLARRARHYRKALERIMDSDGDAKALDLKLVAGDALRGEKAFGVGADVNVLVQ